MKLNHCFYFIPLLINIRKGRLNLFLPFILLAVILVKCSGDNPSEGSESESPEDPVAQYELLDEVPEQIRDLENLKVYPGDAVPTHTLELIPEQTYGKEGEPYLTQILSVVVDENERVILMNSGTNYVQQIYVYNEDGSYRTKIGRKGNGPGEYQIPLPIGVFSGRFLVNDVLNKRINIYNTMDYSLNRTLIEEELNIRDHAEAEGFNFSSLIPRTDGNMYAVFTERFKDEGRPVFKFLLMNLEGEALDYKTAVFRSGIQVIKPNSMQPSMLRPLHFMGSTLVEPSPDDELFSLFTRDLLIKKWNENGQYESAIYYKIKGTPLDLNEFTKSSAYNRRDIMSTLERYGEELPETDRVVKGLKVDDENRIWVAMVMQDEAEQQEWWVLEPGGELRAKVLLPADSRGFQFKNGFLYGKETNEETGSEYVVKYRMDWSESE